MTDTALAAIVAAVIGGFVTLATKYWPVHKPRKSEAERLDAEKWQLLREVRIELEECRKRSDDLEQHSKVDRWRVALLVRALQEAQIPVPAAALLDVVWDPNTDTYAVKRPIL